MTLAIASTAPPRKGSATPAVSARPEADGFSAVFGTAREERGKILPGLPGAAAQLPAVGTKATTRTHPLEVLAAFAEAAPTRSAGPTRRDPSIGRRHDADPRPRDRASRATAHDEDRETRRDAPAETVPARHEPAPIAARPDPVSVQPARHDPAPAPHAPERAAATSAPSAAEPVAKWRGAPLASHAKVRPDPTATAIMRSPVTTQPAESRPGPGTQQGSATSGRTPSDRTDPATSAAPHFAAAPARYVAPPEPAAANARASQAGTPVDPSRSAAKGDVHRRAVGTPLTGPTTSPAPSRPAPVTDPTPQRFARTAAVPTPPNPMIQPAVASTTAVSSGAPTTVEPKSQTLVASVSTAPANTGRPVVSQSATPPIEGGSPTPRRLVGEDQGPVATHLEPGPGTRELAGVTAPSSDITAALIVPDADVPSEAVAPPETIADAPAQVANGEVALTQPDDRVRQPATKRAGGVAEPPSVLSDPLASIAPKSAIVTPSATPAAHIADPRHAPTTGTPIAELARSAPADAGPAPAPAATPNPFVDLAPATADTPATSAPAPASAAALQPESEASRADTVASAAIARVAPQVGEPLSAASLDTAAQLVTRPSAASRATANRAAMPIEPQAPTLTTAAALAAASAAAAPSQPAPLDMTRHTWPAAMIARIERLRDEANAVSTAIRLVPDALGAIDVQVRQEGEVTHVHLAAEQPQTRALLAEAAPKLAELAEQRGLKLGDAHVQSGSGSNAGQQATPHQTPRQPAASPSRTGAAERAEPTPDTRIA